MTEFDLSNENLRKTSDQYEELVCDACKEKVKMRCLPIMNKLNRGIPPFPREVVRLTKSLCPTCLHKVMSKKLQEDAKK